MNGAMPINQTAKALVEVHGVPTEAAHNLPRPPLRIQHRPLQSIQFLDQQPQLDIGIALVELVAVRTYLLVLELMTDRPIVIQMPCLLHLRAIRMVQLFMAPLLCRKSFLDTIPSGSAKVVGRVTR